MTTSNIFDVVIGDRPSAAFRWDALWRTWHWLCSPSDGHGIGSTFANHVASYAGIAASEQAATKVEYKIRSGLGDQWVDLAVGFPSLEDPAGMVCFEDVGATRMQDERKKTNLRAYLEWGKQRAINGKKYRLLVVTNSCDPTVATTISGFLGPSLSATSEDAAWGLLTIAETGDWVAKALTVRSASNPILSEYVSWAAKFGPRVMS